MSVAASTGWWVGWAVGLVVVLLAAGLLLTVIALGRRIVRQADDITEALAGARENTAPLFDVTRTNLALDRITRGLRTVRTGEDQDPPRERREVHPADRGPVSALRDAWKERRR